jgi:hypothetical protein
MNTQTLPLIGIVAFFATMYFINAPRNARTPAEAKIARILHVVIVIGFAVLMLFFTEPHTVTP